MMVPLRCPACGGIVTETDDSRVVIKHQGMFLAAFVIDGARKCTAYVRAREQVCGAPVRIIKRRDQQATVALINRKE